MSNPTDTSILDTMTAEEREAIQGHEANPASPNDDADDSGEGEVLDADGKPVEVAEVVAPAIAAQPGEPAAPTAAQSTPETQTPTPEKTAKAESAGYHATLPEDYAANVDEVKAKRAELADQFKSGTIDFDSYNVHLAEVNAQAEALTIQRAKAEISQETSQQAAARQWNAAIGTTMDHAAAVDGIDYRADEAKGKDLDAFVRALGNDQANADKSMQWFLDEAHKRVMALHGLTPGKAAPGAPAVPAKPGPRKASLEGMPASLAQVPGADGPGDVSGDSFAHLDSLDGEALEQAIAKMTPAQRENFTRGI
jgi:hypothetical protein